MSVSEPSDWLGLAGKTVAVTGVANKKSVGYQIGKRLQEAGAQVLWIVHTPARAAELAQLLAPGPVFACALERDLELAQLASALEARGTRLAGLVHSVAYANYARGARPFHETERADFLQAIDISAFSLVALAKALAGRFEASAAVVTVSISTTRMAAENYGYMAPVKAALDSAVVFLAKSFAERGVRFNAVCAGLLKTASSAGIPGYLESYLFAEMATLRKRALETREVADAALFLLSPRSSGINAQGLVVDAGMGVNWFDRSIVERATEVREA